MNHGKIVAVLTTIVALSVGGCAAEPAADGAPSSSEAALSSAQCPAKIEVKLEIPKIESDAQLLAKFQSPSQGETADEAAETLREIAPHLELARADESVTLSGVLMQACAYKTTRSPAGDNAYSMHFSKSSSGFSLRIEQLMDDPNQLFINVPITNVSPTALVVEPSVTGFISAEDTSTGHDGSDGFSYFIGTVKVTAKILN
jgi:hypothetical protein